MADPMRKRTLFSYLIAIFAFLLWLAVPSDCLAQNASCISVRVLDANSGKPVKNIQVWVNSTGVSVSSIGKTDVAGIALYCPGDPIPTSFKLDFFEFNPTDPGVTFNTIEILKTRSVAQNSRNKGKFHNRNPQPGEIVVFGKRWWLIDRLLERWLEDWPDF